LTHGIRASAQVTEEVNMMSRRSWKRALVTGTGAASLVAAGAGIGVAASTAVVDTQSVRLRVVVSDFADGFDSGWHIHPGPVIVQVTEGKFKIYQGECHPRIVHEGETYLEVPYQPVRAVATGHIAWTTSMILPVPDAPMTPVDSPCP
jgi:quercetin dioxygenase-like cupin family protein